jgi:hypothetical protein
MALQVPECFEEVRRRATVQLPIEVNIGERLPVGVADDEAGVGLLGGPGRREAACGRSGIGHDAPIARYVVASGGSGASDARAAAPILARVESGRQWLLGFAKFHRGRRLCGITPAKTAAADA